MGLQTFAQHSTSKRFWIDFFFSAYCFGNDRNEHYWFVILLNCTTSNIPFLYTHRYIHMHKFLFPHSPEGLLLSPAIRIYFKSLIKRKWWHRTQNSQRNKIPKCMRLEVKYFVKIAIDLKMLGHNVRAYCGRYTYITVLYFLNQCIWWLESASSGNLLGMQNIWLQPDLPY